MNAVSPIITDIVKNTPATSPTSTADKGAQSNYGTTKYGKKLEYISRKQNLNLNIVSSYGKKKIKTIIKHRLNIPITTTTVHPHYT